MALWLTQEMVLKLTTWLTVWFIFSTFRITFALQILLRVSLQCTQSMALERQHIPHLLICVVIRHSLFFLVYSREQPNCLLIIAAVSAPPLQPLGRPHGWLITRSRKSSYSSEHRIITPRLRRKYGRSHCSVSIHVWLCSVCICRAIGTYRQFSAPPNPPVLHATELIPQQPINGFVQDRCRCLFIMCS